MIDIMPMIDQLQSGSERVRVHVHRSCCESSSGSWTWSKSIAKTFSAFDQQCLTCCIMSQPHKSISCCDVGARAWASSSVCMCTRPAGACACERVSGAGVIAVALPEEAAENELLSRSVLMLEIGFFIDEIGASFALVRALATGIRSKFSFNRRWPTRSMF